MNSNGKVCDDKTLMKCFDVCLGDVSGKVCVSFLSKTK